MELKKEGVVKFKQKHDFGHSINNFDITDLNYWREIFRQKGLIGQDRNRYNGAGYGNLSKRIEPLEAQIRKRRFLITGTQTGQLEKLTVEHYSLVSEYIPEENLVISQGPIEASSESMTHGTIYDLNTEHRYVFHVHSPDLWMNYDKLSLPFTRKDVAYGTPEMTEEVRRLFRDSNVEERRIFAMMGHEDGIISFGRTAEEAGNVITSHLKQIS